jgi:CDP-glucose 4,6-dehydratase
VEWLVQQLCRKWGGDAGYRIDDGDHPHEASYLKLDCSKARARLGWHPRWELATALDAIVSWTKEHIAGGNLHTACLKQIHDYGRD